MANDDWLCSCHPSRHTTRLIIIPFITSVTTLMMTYLEYEETPEFHKYLEEEVRKKLASQGINATIDTTDMFWKIDPARDFLVSSCVNNPTPEAWSGFLARWVLWHLTTFFIVECKVEVLPRPVKWLPIVWGLTLLIVIWSGIHQFEDFRYSKHYGEQRMMIHILCAFTAFITCWIETVCIWCPSRLLHAAFATLVCAFALIGMQFPNLYVGEILEWSILVLHLVVVWYSYPRVSEEVRQGTWRPWVGCCHCCCRSLDTAQGGGYCCPAGGTDFCRLMPKKGEEEAQDPSAA